MVRWWIWRLVKGKELDGTSRQRNWESTPESDHSLKWKDMYLYLCLFTCQSVRVCTVIPHLRLLKPFLNPKNWVLTFIIDLWNISLNKKNLNTKVHLLAIYRAFNHIGQSCALLSSCVIKVHDHLLTGCIWRHAVSRKNQTRLFFFFSEKLTFWRYMGFIGQWWCMFWL